MGFFNIQELREGLGVVPRREEDELFEEEAPASAPKPEKVQDEGKQPSSTKEGTSFVGDVPGHVSDETPKAPFEAQTLRVEDVWEEVPMSSDPDPVFRRVERDEDGKIMGLSDEDIYSYATSSWFAAELYALADGLSSDIPEEMKALTFAPYIWSKEAKAKNKADTAYEAEIAELMAKLEQAEKAVAEAEAKAQKAEARLSAITEALK